MTTATQSILLIVTLIVLVVSLVLNFMYFLDMREIRRIAAACIRETRLQLEADPEQSAALLSMHLLQCIKALFEIQNTTR